MRAIVWSFLFVWGVLFWVVVLAGCRQLPVLRGTFQDAKVEQSKIDSQQSDRIAGIAEIEAGMGQVVAAIAPDDAKQAAQTIAAKASRNEQQAQAMADRHRERADKEARIKDGIDAQPGISAWIGSAMTGNWSNLIDLALGALGLGGAAYGMRSRAKAMRVVDDVVDGVERYKADQPEHAEILKMHLSRSMDKSTKQKIKESKRRLDA